MPSRIFFVVSVLATRIKVVIWMGLLFDYPAVMQHVVFTGSNCFRISICCKKLLQLEAQHTIH